MAISYTTLKVMSDATIRKIDAPDNTPQKAMKPKMALSTVTAAKVLLTTRI